MWRAVPRIDDSVSETSIPPKYCVLKSKRMYLKTRFFLNYLNNKTLRKAYIAHAMRLEFLLKNNPKAGASIHLLQVG